VEEVWNVWVRNYFGLRGLDKFSTGDFRRAAEGDRLRVTG
jgi:hypothetical protein